jgi:hypothetical protein
MIGILRASAATTSPARRRALRARAPALAARLAILLSIVLFGLLATGATALAAPSMALAATFAQGNRRDEPALATFGVTMIGSEYEGHPLPTQELTLSFPAGSALSDAGFPTCARSVLEPSGGGPKSCPSGSSAGPAGTFTSYIAFGGEVTREQGTVESFFLTEGGVLLFLFGHSPVLVEVLATGHYIPESASGPPGLSFSVPLVETVPGAPLMSLTSLSFGLGETRSEGAVSIGSVTAPRVCAVAFDWGAAGQFGAQERGPPSASASAQAMSPCLPPSPAMLAEEAKKLEEATVAGILGDLARLIVPHGKEARIPSILRHRGFTLGAALAPGVDVAAEWYELPRGFRPAAHAPVLVAQASVKAVSSGAIRIVLRLTRAGRRVLQRDRAHGAVLTAHLIVKGAGGASATRFESFRLQR